VSVAKIFSRQTLEKFEAASASIPLRQLERAFSGANIRLGTDPGGPVGSRRAQFRRYVASVDQHDPQQLEQLGHALSALIDEVAESKVEFLVNAAERDGFLREGGAFRPATRAPRSFAVTRVEDLTSIDERGTRAALLAGDRPQDAVDGALELIASVCRTVLAAVGEAPPAKAADVVAIVKATLKAIGPGAQGRGGAKARGTLVRNRLQQLAAVVADLGEVQDPSPRHARLTVGTAVALAGFIAETHGELSRGRSQASGGVRKRGRTRTV
jgi:hypothetical protein